MSTALATPAFLPSALSAPAPLLLLSVLFLAPLTRSQIAPRPPPDPCYRRNDTLPALPVRRGVQPRPELDLPALLRRLPVLGQPLLVQRQLRVPRHDALGQARGQPARVHAAHAPQRAELRERLGVLPALRHGGARVPEPGPRVQPAVPELRRREGGRKRDGVRRGPDVRAGPEAAAGEAAEGGSC